MRPARNTSRREGERGVTILLVTVALVVMLGMAALGIDVVTLYVARTEAQRAASDTLRASVGKGGFSVTLVDGVTGSGKTEVYFEAVAEAIRQKKQVLILMPEIALTAQFLDRFIISSRESVNGT